MKPPRTHNQPRLLSLRRWEIIESIVNLEDVTLSLFFWSYCNAVRYLLIANYDASGWRRTQIRKITFQNECYDMCLLCIMKTILQMFRILFVTKRRPDCHHHYFLQLLWMSRVTTNRWLETCLLHNIDTFILSSEFKSMGECSSRIFLFFSNCKNFSY